MVTMMHGLAARYYVRAFHSTDQSFPLAGAFAYSVYKYQSRRMKDKPEGPHFGGSPVVGAVLTTAINIAVACAVSVQGHLGAPHCAMIGYVCTGFVHEGLASTIKPACRGLADWPFLHISHALHNKGC